MWHLNWNKYTQNISRSNIHWSFLTFLPPASEGWGKVMFSVCSYWGGGVSPAGGGVRSSWPGGGGVSQLGGSGPAGQGGGSGPASWGGVRSNWPGGVRSSQQGGGVRSSQRGGGVSILRPLAGGMPLAFTQEDFLVYLCVWL